MSKPLAPARAANEISVILNAALGTDRFPVDVKDVAREISKIKFPDEPVTMIRGGQLDGFDGARGLLPVSHGAGSRREAISSICCVR